MKLHEEIYNDHRLTAYYDEFASQCLNPRDDDNASVIYAWHSNYDFSDQSVRDVTIEEFEEMRDSFALSFPIYMLDHSGLFFSLDDSYPFDCKWDSGILGFITLTKQALEDEFKGDLDHAKKCLNAEFETFKAFNEGQVYSVHIVQINNDICDCCNRKLEDTEIESDVIGYMGDLDCAIDMAKEIVDRNAREEMVTV